MTVVDHNRRPTGSAPGAAGLGCHRPTRAGGERLAGPKDHGQVVVEKETKTRAKLKRPKLYKVILHNDDFTTMEFVVAVLRHIFHKSEGEAEAIMLHIHRTGMGVAGVYSYEIAEAKVAETMAAAEDAEYPLMCTLEPDDLDDPDAG